MVNIRLENAEGQLVTTGRIPPFTIEPKVILWGQRVFTRATDESLLIYREAFAVYLVDTD